MPLAGKPPFATDEPDSHYESSAGPQRRLRQPRPEDPNKRTSAYDVYDNYVDNAASRQSGMGALGEGFLNGSMDDDSDDEDEPQHSRSAGSKNAALAAAAGVSTGSQNAPSHPPSPPQQRQPIAAPQPGYTAPIAALNLARPEPAATPQGRQPSPRHENPFEPTTPRMPQPNASFPPPSPHSPFPPPSPSSTAPHPLQPPRTPIVPVFARPNEAVKFSEPIPRQPKPIMRGNSEETLLPKRGERGDDFWRRFSMVAKEPNAGKESAWLKRTQERDSNMSRWVWIVGMFLLLAIGAGAGLGWYFTHNKPSHQVPTAIGGSASETVGGTAPIIGAPTTQATSTESFHVSPTHTVQRREPEPTPIEVFFPRSGEAINQAHKKRRLQWQ